MGNNYKRCVTSLPRSVWAGSENVVTQYNTPKWEHLGKCSFLLSQRDLIICQIHYTPDKLKGLNVNISTQFYGIHLRVNNIQHIGLC